MIVIENKEKCSGCTACVAVCPKNCISMVRDEEGFLYPEADQSLCVECGACEAVCERASAPLDDKEETTAYGAYSKDSTMRSTSSSGGVFTVLAEEIIRRGGMVAGAAFTPDFHGLTHIIVKNEEELIKLRTSKYLQSNPGDIFVRLKEELEEGKLVLFTGTPCQTDGFRAYLGKDYSNLMTADLVCHGVPSPGFWDRYLREKEEASGGKAQEVNFRFKKYSWEKTERDGLGKGETAEYLSKGEDPYMRLFLRNYILRPSCHSCSHKGTERKSDITMADFWGIGKVLPELSDGKGTSLILVHSSKGRELISDISDRLIIKETDKELAVKYNSSCVASAPVPGNLEKFREDQKHMTVKELAEKYDPVSTKAQLKAGAKKSGLYGLLNKGKSGTNMESGLMIKYCKK